MSDILSSFAIIAPFLNDLTINDTGVYVTDREKYLAIVHAKTFQMSVKEGDIIPKGTVLRECMMPRMDGYTACKKIRALQQPPIIMLQSDPFLRAELVYISYYALDANVAGTGLTLRQTLLSQGVFTSADITAAGALAPSGRLS